MAKKIIDPKTSLKARETYAKLKRMYRNNWKDDLDDRLKEQYDVPEIYRRFAKFKDVSVNIFRLIIRRICSVYKKPAVRELIKGEKTVKSDIWNNWKKETNLDVIMQEAHRLSKACTTCYLHIRTSEKKEKIMLHVYTPDIIHVETDPEDNITPISISYMFTVIDPKYKKKNTQYWVYYNNEHRYFLNQAGELLKKDPRTDESYSIENKYGIIPIIPFPAELPVVEFNNEHWNENAYEANTHIGITKTRMNVLIKWQTHKQMWIAGQLEEKLKNATISEAAALFLDEGGQAGVIDLNSSALESLMKIIQQNIITIGEEFGISPDQFVAQGNVQSGFALKIKSQSLEEIREADVPICSVVEKQLFKMIRIINNIDFKDQISENLTLNFNPGEVTFPEPWVEEQQKWEFKFVLGVANAIDYLIKEDPDLTRKDAEKKLLEIRAETERIKPKKGLVEQLIDRERLRQGTKKIMEE